MLGQPLKKFGPMVLAVAPALPPPAETENKPPSFCPEKSSTSPLGKMNPASRKSSVVPNSFLASEIKST